MNKQDETIADVANILRIRAANISDGGAMADGAELRDLADRIESAAERERNAHTNDIHNALYMATGIPGNAAAMREALNQLRDWALLDINENAIRSDEPNYKKLVDGIVEITNNVLAAPARNCDRFSTELDARLAWKREAHCNGDYRYWLFDKAEGGDHA